MLYLLNTVGYYIYNEYILRFLQISQFFPLIVYNYLIFFICKKERTPHSVWLLWGSNKVKYQWEDSKIAVKNRYGSLVD